MEPPLPPPASRTREVVGSIVGRARGLVRFTRTVAIVEMAAAAVLWLIAAKPLQASAGNLAAGLVFLCILLLPGAIIWLFYTGVSSVATLPEALEKMGRGGTDQGKQLVGAARDAASHPGWKSGWNVIRSILEFRSSAVRAKSVLLGLGVVLKLRFLNPFFLALVVLSFAASATVVVLAAIALIATLL